MPVDLALTPDNRWSADAHELATAAGAAGFAAVGLGVEQALTADPAALAATGVRCHDVLALMVTRNEDRTLESARRLAAAADAVGAEWVLTIPAARPSPESAALLGEVGVRLAIEFSPLGPVTSIAAARALADAAGGRAGVMVDTWHFFRGDSTWEQLEQIPLDALAYVQFDDAPPPASDDGFAETMNHRVFPGQGNFELERFAGTLLDRGWHGTVSVEVLNSELAELPVSEFARAAFDATARYWR